MTASHRYRLLRPGGYSAKKMVKPVPFVCSANGAQAVFIVGDFNDWDPTTHPLKRQHDGAWRIELPLCHGHHHYLFVIDGTPALDPCAQGVARNERGEKVSLIAVS
jgi:1,4-alpha-glucan branching enzyme